MSDLATDGELEEQVRPNRGGTRHDFRERWLAYPQAKKEGIAGDGWKWVDDLARADPDPTSITYDLLELDRVTAAQVELRRQVDQLERDRIYLYARLLAQDVEQSVVGEHAGRTAMAIKYATGTPKPPKKTVVPAPPVKNRRTRKP